MHEDKNGDEKKETKEAVVANGAIINGSNGHINAINGELDQSSKKDKSTPLVENGGSAAAANARAKAMSSSTGKQQHLEIEKKTESKAR